jgi:hypothetical protein
VLRIAFLQADDKDVAKRRSWPELRARFLCQPQKSHSAADEHKTHRMKGEQREAGVFLAARCLQSFVVFLTQAALWQGV